MSIIASESDQVSYPDINLNDESLLALADVAKDFSIHIGMCMRSRDLNAYDARVPASFCLFPSPFPEVWFDFAKNIQTDINYVIHKVAHSPEFLYNCLKSTIETDDFIANLWQIYKDLETSETTQLVSLGMLRSDYMLNENESEKIIGLKQIENNTFASSFGGLAPKILNLHSFVLEKCGMKASPSQLPYNSSCEDFAKGLIDAWKLYGNKNAAILFVVEDITYNICDQRVLEFSIWDMDKDVRVLRYTFAELRNSAVLRENALVINDNEIAVVYYRWGYSPNQYKGEEDWKLRHRIERSKAIKCPTVGYHLAGTKKVQLHLSLPGIVERFLPDGANPCRIREVFAQQHSLEMNEDGNKAVLLGKDKPDAFVLKPEREGGGHNIFGEEIKTVLDSIGDTESRASYILMEKINPPVHRNCIVRSQNVPKFSGIVAELGIYGVILGSKDAILKNYQAGHLLRSKELSTNEVGIAAGFGALDSPFLTNEISSF